MTEIFHVPMRRGVQTAFLAMVALVTAAAVWSFRSGLLWTGLCLMAVAVPLTVLYWFMLFVSPSRSKIVVDGGNLYLEAKPFLKTSQPLDAVERAFTLDLDGKSALEPLEKKRCMAFLGYRAGMFAAASGKEAVVLARGPKTLCLQTPERWYVLGPSDLSGLIKAVSATVEVKDG